MRPWWWIVIPGTLTILLISCGQATPAGPTPPAHSRFYQNANLRIGSHGDQPGIGLYDFKTNAWSGLDVDVAYYVMGKLRITFTRDNNHLHPVQTADRDDHLLKGIDNLIIASYSITDGRINKGITFSIPYLFSFQDILIREADKNKIKSVEDLRAHDVCTTSPASTPYQHLDVLNKKFSPKMILDPQASIALCVDRLIAGDTDAVVTDNAILYGHEAANPGLYLVNTQVWNRPEQYGIGMIAKTPADATEINNAIKDMIKDGTWAKSIVANFCPKNTPPDHPCDLAQTFLRNPPTG